MEVERSQAKVPAHDLRLPGLSILVPAYNEEATLERVVQDLLEVAPAVSEESEIIIIDDGSADRTPAIADQLCAERSCVRVIHHPRNLGFGATQRTGFKEAKLPFITLVPADGQFPASDLARFLPCAKNSDIVLGYRVNRPDGFRRRIQTAIFHWVTYRMLGLPFRDINWVKLYRREAVSSIEIKSRKIGVDAEVLVQVQRRGGRIREVEVSYLARAAGVASGSRFSVVLETVLELLKIWKERVVQDKS